MPIHAANIKLFADTGKKNAKKQKSEYIIIISKPMILA
jgi:hypothetical protein